MDRTAFVELVEALAGFAAAVVDDDDDDDEDDCNWEPWLPISCSPPQLLIAFEFDGSRLDWVVVLLVGGGEDCPPTLTTPRARSTAALPMLPPKLEIPPPLLLALLLLPALLPLLPPPRSPLDEHTLGLGDDTPDSPRGRGSRERGPMQQQSPIPLSPEIFSDVGILTLVTRLVSVKRSRESLFRQQYFL